MRVWSVLFILLCSCRTGTNISKPKLTIKNTNKTTKTKQITVRANLSSLLTEGVSINRCTKNYSFQKIKCILYILSKQFNGRTIKSQIHLDAVYTVFCHQVFVWTVSWTFTAPFVLSNSRRWSLHVTCKLHRLKSQGNLLVQKFYLKASWKL